MTIHHQQGDRREAYARLADPSIYRDTVPPHERPVPPAGDSTAQWAGEQTATGSDVGDADRARDRGYDRAEAPAEGYDEAPARRDDAEEYAEVGVRERFGGVNWGAGFYGWLVAVAMTVLLTGVAGAVVGMLDRLLPAFPGPADLAPTTLALAATATVVVVLMGAHFAGGYVAGRMSRFDGGKQGAGVWVTGVLMTMTVVGAGLLFGWQYNLFARVDLPSFSLPQETLGIAGAGAAVAALLGTLLAAIGGGKVGRGYHRKVDEYAYDADLDTW
jgi:hypothetical protein